MNRLRHTVLSAVTVVTALGLCGCGSGTSTDDTARPSPISASTTAPVTPPSAPLPAPETLTDVLYRLADVAVPGADKIALVEQGTPGDAAALDKFGRALDDNGFLPLTITATDLAWSPSEHGNVVATVDVTAESDPARRFSFPMEFTAHGDGWQLTRHTADQLLVLGADAAAPAPPPEPPR